MTEAYSHRIASWYRIESTGDARVQDVILALAAGNPVVYGTKVDQAWMDYDGTTPLGVPKGSVLGGHATVLEGWDATRGVFFGENSWGDSWGVAAANGIRGFYELLPEVVSNSESSDFVVYQDGWEDWTK